jgi:hypothetical protein
VVISVRLVRGGLVSGALVIRVGWAGPVASTALHARACHGHVVCGVGRGNAAVAGSAGSGTLLGPEETGRRRNLLVPPCGVGEGFAVRVLSGCAVVAGRVRGVVSSGRD